MHFVARECRAGIGVDRTAFRAEPALDDRIAKRPSQAPPRASDVDVARVGRVPVTDVDDARHARRTRASLNEVLQCLRPSWPAPM